MTAGFRVVHAGMQTTVQDTRGRQGLWDVGVPPSGAYDDLTLERLNRMLGNPDTAAGLECVMVGPTLVVDADVIVAIGGAECSPTVDGRAIRCGGPVRVRAGSTLEVGPLDGLGMRAYLAVQGGLDTPRVLGSRATFLLGGFGGHEGRSLIAGDALPIRPATNLIEPAALELPTMADHWELRVIPGPHGAPDYLTDDGVEEFLGTEWAVDHRADRTGIRLIGPTPQWSRTNGGEAGMHPSNLHDSAYPVGGIMLSGDTPVIVGVDGPSLGGFVVPAVVIEADRWMLGQVRPGDRVRLRAVSLAQAQAAMAVRRGLLTASEADDADQDVRPTPLAVGAATSTCPAWSISMSGDRHVLVQAGATEFDLSVRMWVHLLAESLRDTAAPGITEIVEGVRSVLVAIDTTLTDVGRVGRLLADLAPAVPDPETTEVASREVVLPIAFDHPAAHEAMQRYRSVNPTAPWCPDNVEFIRRVNDLEDRDDVFDVVADATYLVVGLGDVYLGAPVAVPLDPRHRLVTTKYNPARTWTAQNSVGIGGIYLCIYGMEGPGGYQLVGRTVPVWRLGGSSTDPRPWLLRPFDRIRFVPVSADQLATARADIEAGEADLSSSPGTFSLAQVRQLEESAAEEIATVRSRRRAAFDAELRRWAG